jgi:hypothetical protein
MRRIVGVLAFGLMGCPSHAPTPAPSASATPTPSPTASATAIASAHSNGARKVSEETDDYLFDYAYPKEAGQIPALAALLDGRMDKDRTELAQQSAEARKDARGAGFPYNKYSLATEWKVVSDLPDWLSLSGDVTSYVGGAHGNHGFDSLVWDKAGGRAFEGIALFQSVAALDKALGDQLCAALNRERARRRGEPVKPGSTDEFDKCVSVKDATVLVGSRSHRKFDRITVQFGPYAAGPYSEGAYTLDFNIDRAVLAAVKPEFRDAFAARN